MKQTSSPNSNTGFEVRRKTDGIRHPSPEDGFPRSYLNTQIGERQLISSAAKESWDFKKQNPQFIYKNIESVKFSPEQTTAATATRNGTSPWK